MTLLFKVELRCSFSFQKDISFKYLNEKDKNRPTNCKDKEDTVGEEGCKVNNLDLDYNGYVEDIGLGDDLATGLHPLDEAECDEEPGRTQTTHILPPDHR